MTRGLLALLVALSLAVGLGIVLTPRAEEEKLFGVYADPWSGLRDWNTKLAVCPIMPAQFEAWSRTRTLDEHFLQVKQTGGHYFITWEPWAPPPWGKSFSEQGAIQADFSNQSIWSGVHDDYIRSFARSARLSGLELWVRWGHEMNGDWYPWHNNPGDYRLAWRHIHDIFETEGAANVNFVFSINPNLFQDEESFQRDVLLYWPGGRYVDYVGATMISFGGGKTYQVQDFLPRFAWLSDEFQKDFLITEMSVPHEKSAEWVSAVSLFVKEADWVKGLVMSDEPSRYQSMVGSKWEGLRPIRDSNDPRVVASLSALGNHLGSTGERC